MPNLPRALCLVAFAFGCDHADPPRPPRPPPRPIALRAPPRAEEEAPVVGESSTGETDDPIGRCVRRNRDALGPELARALAALQDDALLSDACGLDLAVRGREPARCDAVRLSSLREACVFRASIAAALPAACPPAPGLRGRDPVCVALASRDPALCAAASSAERARCLALAARDPRPCAALDPLLRPACARDLPSLATLVPAMPRRALLDPAADRNAWQTAVDDASVDEPEPWLRRGVFLDEAGALWIVDPALGWPGPDAMAADRPQVGVTSASRRGASVAYDARLVIPGAGVLSSADGSLRAMVTLTHAPRSRGGRVAGSVRFEGATAGRAVGVTLRFDTFIRDVVAAAALR